MAVVKLSNCGHDENGKYAGGKAGDQTGTEYQIINWYSRPWYCCLRFEDQEVASLIAEEAMQAANNNMIGYDQGTAGNSNDRYTFWEQLEANGYDPSKIKKTCETDCSQSTASIVKSVGYRLNRPKLKAVSIYLTTYKMREALKNAGAKVLTDKKYLTSGDYLKAGDILLNDDHHVAIVVTSGAKAEATVTNRGYLCKGDTGADVKTMQEMLIKVGYSCGTAGADGDFGSGTDAALRRFQEENGLTVNGKADGKYGPNSKAKLTDLSNLTDLYIQKNNSSKKDIETVVQEVLAGKWGDDPQRTQRLKAAGYDPAAVQSKVNAAYKSKNTKTIDDLVQEVLAGKWGDDPERTQRLKAAGYDSATVQAKVNEWYKNNK